MPNKKTNKFELPRKSLKEISKTHPESGKEPIYPVKRKMKFIDFDSTAETLQNMGWRNLTNDGIPNTPDTVAFKSEHIIPVEIKWRNKSKQVSKKTKQNSIESLGKKLATFSSNIYELHNKTPLEYWMILSFPEKENISEKVRISAIKFVKECAWLSDKGQVIESIESLKIKQIEADIIQSMKLDGRNKSPKWFVKAYESSETKIVKPVVKKLTPKKAKTGNKTVVKNAVKLDNSKGSIDPTTIAEEFKSYKIQQLEMSRQLIKAINKLSSEVSSLRKESKKREVIIKTKG